MFSQHEVIDMPSKKLKESNKMVSIFYFYKFWVIASFNGKHYFINLVLYVSKPSHCSHIFFVDFFTVPASWWTFHNVLYQKKDVVVYKMFPGNICRCKITLHGHWNSVQCRREKTGARNNGIYFDYWFLPPYAFLY